MAESRREISAQHEILFHSGRGFWSSPPPTLGSLPDSMSKRFHRSVLWRVNFALILSLSAWHIWTKRQRRGLRSRSARNSPKASCLNWVTSSSSLCSSSMSSTDLSSSSPSCRRSISRTRRTNWSSSCRPVTDDPAAIVPSQPPMTSETRRISNLQLLPRNLDSVKVSVRG